MIVPPTSNDWQKRKVKPLGVGINVDNKFNETKIEIKITWVQKKMNGFYWGETFVCCCSWTIIILQTKGPKWFKIFNESRGVGNSTDP